MYKRQRRKKIISIVIAITLLTTIFVVPQGSVSAANYNYGEALQKAIMFYEFQRSGKIPENSRNNWRGDSGMTDGADNNIDLTGGWYDAGDHVKFNLPLAYSVTMMAWSYYECKDAYEKSGQLPYLRDNIKWATDYLMKCHPSPNVYYYQVGDGEDDHSWWGPAEVMQMARPSYKLDTSKPGSAVAAETAAALAASSILFKGSDPDYAKTCLKHAKELFVFADTTRSDAGYTAAYSFYTSHSGFYDELTWASLWLYLATDDEKYVEQAESYEPKWEREPLSTTIKYKWAHCWDQKLFGSLLLLTRITGKSLYKEAFERHLDWWTTGVGGERIDYTPKGLAWLDRWGSLRYATTEAFLACVYADWDGADTAKADTYKDFAKTQVDYALGSTGRSFVVGYGTNPPKRPHHRTAHGSYIGYLTGDTPPYHRHVLVGALVGGPGKTDGYADDVNNYENNEVANDYNAGFVAVLAKMYGKFGGTPIANLNAIETPIDDEFSVKTSANSYGSKNNVAINLTLSNMTAWPARAVKNLTCRYFVNITEVIQAGYKPSDVTCTAGASTVITVSSLIPWNKAKNIYYVDVDFSAAKLAPYSNNAYQKTASFKISLPAGVDVWDNTNDFSYNDTPTSDWQGVLTKKIPVYENGVKAHGEEPEGDIVSPTPTKKPPTATPTSTSTPTPTTSSTTGYTVSGSVKPGFKFSSSSAAIVNSGFKVEIEGTEISALTDSTGSFILKDVPKSSKAYTLRISKAGFLNRKVQNLTVSDDKTISQAIELWAGDMIIRGVQDGAINMKDIVEMADVFNSSKGDAIYVADCDINKDNAINMTDITIVAAHFNKAVSNYPVFTIE